MSTKTKTTKKTTKRAGFKRAHQYTDAELRTQFGMYIESAIAAYRADEKSIEKCATEDKDWGKKYGNKSINFFEAMREGMKEFMSGSWELGIVCPNCGESDQSCDCTLAERGEDDEDDD